jgi:uncharacterized protein YacL
MYYFFLHAHSGLRWLVLLAAIILVVKSTIGMFSRGSYGKLDNILSASFVGLMHTQLLLGLILYFFLSPITTRFTFNMKDPVERFWSVEHLSLMLFAIAAAQIGRSISKKSKDAPVKFRYQLTFYGISLVLMLLGIPWDRF